MNDPSGFSMRVPGFDFLQTLVKSAGAAMPGIGQWVAPTIDPEELAKRIEELRTVQFWLEQNARMIGATIQAMEVQRMTLSTLKTMNVQMEDLRDSLKMTIPGMAPPSSQSPSPATPPRPAAAPAPAGPADAETPPRPAPIDPMQWWGALARQFADIAAGALRDPNAEAARAAAAAAVSAPGDPGSAATPAPAENDASAPADARPRAARTPAARKTAAPR